MTDPIWNAAFAAFCYGFLTVFCVCWTLVKVNEFVRRKWPQNRHYFPSGSH